MIGVDAEAYTVIVAELAETLFYSNVEVPLVVIKDSTENIAGLELKLKQGAKTRLPYVYAMELISKGVAQIDFESMSEVQNMKKVCWNEEKSEGLLPLEEGFYLKLRLYVSYLKSEVERGNRAKEAELKSVRILFSDLLSLRLKKIVRLALASQHPEREKMKNMTLEEQVLYAQLCNAINSWVESMRKLVGVA